MVSKFLNSEKGKVATKAVVIFLIIALALTDFIFVGVTIGKMLESYAVETENEEEPNVNLSQEFLTNKIYEYTNSETSEKEYKRKIQTSLNVSIEPAGKTISKVSINLADPSKVKDEKKEECLEEYSINTDDFEGTVLLGKTLEKIEVISHETENFVFDEETRIITIEKGENETLKNEYEFIVTYTYKEDNCLKNEETGYFEVSEYDEETGTYVIKEDQNVKLFSAFTCQIDFTDNTSMSANKWNYVEETYFGDVTIIKTTASDIYKGNMYLDKDTTYSKNVEISITDLDLVNELLYIWEWDSFWFKYSYKSSSSIFQIPTTPQEIVLDKNEMVEVLGEEGFILIVDYFEFYNELEAETIEEYIEENKMLLSEIEEEEIQIDFEETSISAIVVTSKPINKGVFNIESKKIIDIDRMKETIKEDYPDITDEEIQELLNEIETLSLSTRIMDLNESINVGGLAVELKEPQYKSNLSLTYTNTNQTALSTVSEEGLGTNEVIFTVDLIAEDESCNLYKEPEISIVLPEEIVGAENISASLKYSDGLEVGRYTFNENTNSIDVILTGEQTEYKEEIQSLTVTATLNVEEGTETKDVTITAQGKNEGTLGEVETKIVAPEGLIQISEIYSDVESEKSVSIEDTNTLKIENMAEEKEVTQEVKLINNYDEAINNVEIIGELDTNFTSSLTGEITLSEAEGTIYYSLKKVEETVDADWKTSVTDFSKVKSFKISLKNSLDVGGKVNFVYKLSIPENLEYNSTATMGIKTNFVKGAKDVTKTLDMVVTTGVGPKVDLKITPKTQYETLHGGQIVNYVLTVENTGDVDIEELELNYEIDENGSFINNLSYCNSAIQYDEESRKNKEILIENLKIGNIYEAEFVVKIANIDENGTIESKLKAIYKNKKIAEDILRQEIEISQGIVKLTTMAEKIYDENDEIIYRIDFASESNVVNSKIEFMIPNYLDYKTTYILDDNFEEEIVEASYDTVTRKLEYNLGDLNEGDKRYIYIKVNVSKLPKELNYEYKPMMTALVTGDNMTAHESNALSTEILVSDISIMQSSKNEYTLEEYSNIEYEINIQNIGKREKYVEIKDEIPNIINIDKVMCNENGIKYEVQVEENNLTVEKYIKPDSSLSITIYGTIGGLGYGIENLEIENTAYVNDIATETIKNEIVPFGSIIEEENPEVPGEDEENTPTENPDKEDEENPEEKPGQDEENPDGENSEIENEEKQFTISGTVWNDLNKNGEKEETESKVEGILVLILNFETGEFVKEDDGNILKLYTDSEGKYETQKLAKGKYKVVFKYDSKEYGLTTYKAKGVSETLNSDVKIQTITLDEDKFLAGVTDELNLNNTSYINIDMGLTESAKFDVSLNKTISKVTVKNDEGNTVYEYKNTNLAKVEIPAKYIKGTTLIIEYNLEITNEGDVSAYVSDLYDYLPKNTTFSSELNTNWYLGNDGILHNNSLEQKELKPNEKVIEKLIITKTLSSSEAVTIENEAEIGKVTNKQGLEEYDSNFGNKNINEDDYSKAELIVSIKTGSIILYIGITLASLMILFGGIYLINKKILKEEI